MPARGQKPWNKKFVDESAFDELDERKAALFGLLMADGRLSRSGRQRHLTLCLALREPGPVYLLKEVLGAEHDVRVYQPVGPEDYIYALSHSLSIMVSDHLSTRLQGLGMTHPKPTRCPTGIPQSLESHFVRGYFEGDGSVWWWQPRTRSYSGCTNSNIAVHPPMAKWLSSIFEREGVIGGCYQMNGCLRLVFGKASSEKLYHYLYGGATTILLPEKKRRFEELLSRSAGGGS